MIFKGSLQKMKIKYLKVYPLVPSVIGIHYFDTRNELLIYRVDKNEQ